MTSAHQECGEYHSVFPQLLGNRAKFYEYTRMTEETNHSDYLTNFFLVVNLKVFPHSMFFTLHTTQI